MDELELIVEEIESCEECRVESAVKRIVAFGERAVPPLQELLSSDDPDVRWWAAWALAETKSPQAPELLVNTLKDPSPQVRQAAVLALRYNPTPIAIPHLIEMLGEADAVLVRLASAALQALGSQAVPALLEALERGNQQVRLESARTLALVGDQRAIPALFEALENDSALIEFWANEGLDRMGLGMTFFKP